MKTFSIHRLQMACMSACINTAAQAPKELVKNTKGEKL